MDGSPPFLAIDTVPASMRAAYQEYDLQRLDLDRDKTLIIERILAWGGRSEFRWLFGRYGWQAVGEWVAEMGHRRLPARRYALWCVLLDLPRQPRQSSLWPH